MDLRQSERDNKFSATSKKFHRPIILGHDNSYNIPWYIEYRNLRIPRYIDQENKKKQTGSFIKFSYRTVSQFPNLNVVYFERLSRSNLSNTKFQSSNLNSSYSLNLTSEFLIFDKTSFI